MKSILIGCLISLLAGCTSTVAPSAAVSSQESISLPAAPRGEASSNTSSEPDRPDLAVVIVLDQFRSDYVTRFEPWFSTGGFNRFLKTGANFTSAYHPHSITATSAGFASIGSGLPPSVHGIIANDWFDRFEDKSQYCVGDSGTRPIGGASRTYSPVNLLGVSLGDRLLEISPQSKVIGVALKDRSAIAPAGKRALAAYWWDDDTNRYVSSSYYRTNPAVMAFNAVIPEAVATHPVWDLSGLIPGAMLEKVAFDPPELRKYKTNSNQLGVEFPHPIKDAGAFKRTPFAAELTLRFALHVIDVEALGEDDSPDLLYVGLNASDYIGHDFGPDSYEVADNAVRTDRYLESFLNELDRRLKGKVTVVITSDHGIQRMPEVATALGEMSARFDFRGPGAATKTIGELRPVRKYVEKELGKRMGFELPDDTPIAKRMIREYVSAMIYLNWPRIRELGLDGERVKGELKAIIQEFKEVSGVFTNTELMRYNDAPGDLERAVRLSFHGARSGDLIFTLKPGFVANPSAGTGTTHREPIEADQHVPLMLWGVGIEKGSYTQRVAPMDIAPTLGRMFGVNVGERYSTPLPCLVAVPK